MGHKKPTTEELEEAQRKAIEEAEQPDTPKSVPPEDNPAEPPAEDNPPAPEPTPNEPPVEPLEAPEEPDYRKKYVESSREALVLHTKNKKLNEAVEKASAVPDPTEEELRAEFSEWEEMTETERKLAKSAFTSTRRFRVLEEATREFKDIDEWKDNVDKFADNPATLVNYPALEGKVDDFRVFALKPTRRGLDFADLVAAFLYEAGKQKPKPNKGQMFDTGSGGPNEKPKPKSDKISVDEAANLMKTDYNKYKELLKAGKIDYSTV